MCITYSNFKYATTLPILLASSKSSEAEQGPEGACADGSVEVSVCIEGLRWASV